MPKILVLVIDDSALVRQTLIGILSSDRGIEVVGTAPNPIIARQKIERLKPDVLTLDVEMPEMDGLTFLRQLMSTSPMPVVMISAYTQEGAETTLQALEYGAVDFMPKPKMDIAQNISQQTQEIIHKIKAAATAKARPYRRRVASAASSTASATHACASAASSASSNSAPSLLQVQPKYSADVILTSMPRRGLRGAGKIIAIGASTGGTEAIQELLSELPANTPAVVISQHIPAPFSGPFAARIDKMSAMHVSEAKDGEPILPGHAYVAPGGQHLLVEVRSNGYFCRLNDGMPVNRHRPSVDVMFRSVAMAAGSQAIGVILTGMGDDGARGMREMHDAGAYTIAQDEETSVVWGMPKEAIKHGGVDLVLPLDHIAGKLITVSGLSHAYQE